MASGNIKGIKIEIDGDTKGLNKALDGVNKQSRDLQGELKSVERGLKFDPGNVELVRQKQELLTASITATSEKLDVLKTAQSQVEAQFQRGDIGIEQYRAFQRELQSTESEMKRLRSQYDSINIDQERLAQVTRELGTFFNATNTDVEQFAGTLGTRLTQAIRDGSASADQMERALRLMGQQALGASTDIDKMRETLRSVDNGSSLDEIRVDFKRVSESAKEAEESVKGFGDELSTVVGGLAAGGGIAGVVSSALDASSLSTKIDISFNVPEESKQSIIEAVRTIEAYGIEGEEALEGIRRQWALNKDASDEVNSAFVEGAAVIAKAYAGIDFIELVQETNEFAAALQISNEEALALTDALLKTGFPPEQLDILSEYGLQMKAIGFSTAEIQAIFEKGIETKSWNIDNLNDGVKEARLQMATFGLEIPKALKPLITDTGLSLTQFQNWGKAVAGGGKEGAIAMAEVSNWLQTIEDDALRNEMAIKVFGTKAEDQGDNMIAVFQGLADAQDKTTQNLNQYHASVERMNADPLVRIKDAFADIMTSLQPLLLMVADFVAKIAEWVSNNAGLAAALLAIGTALGVLTGGFAVLMPAIGALVGLWPALVAAISGIGAPILLAVGAIVGLGLAFTKLWQESETFRNTLTNVFNSIKDVVTSVLDVVVAFVQEKVSKIKEFWTQEGQQILTAVENAFNGIKGVIEKVMPAVQFIIEYVWTAIQNVINGALDVIMGAVKVFSGLFTGDFSKMWEGVKQIFSGAVDLIVGLMSLSFVGSLRTLLVNLGKSAFSLMKGMWDDVARAFSNGVKSANTSVVNFIKNIGTNFKSLLTNTTQVFSNMWRSVVDSVTKLATGSVNAIKGLPAKFLQIGKELMQGLINGIKDMTQNAIGAITGVVNGVVEKAKSLLGIASPSKVFTQIGKWTGEGLEKGITSTKKTNEKAMKDITDVISNITKKNASEISAIAKKAEEERTKVQNDYQKKRSNMKKKDATKIRDLEADMHEKLKKINDKAWADMQKKESEVAAARVEAINSFIENKKKANELSLIDEAEYWRVSYKQFDTGTKENLALQQSYQDNVKRINDAITNVNDGFLSRTQQINNELAKGEQDLNQKYADALNSRYQTILGYYGLFDAVTKGEAVDKSELTGNLQDQVSSLKDWSGQIEQLKKRKVSSGLITELQGMGVKALEQLKALNSMTDAELSNYQKLYQQKMKVAKEQAIKELEPMKRETQSQIQALRDAANIELTKLNTEWQNAIKKVVGGTDQQLKTLHQVGKNAGQGLLSGLSSMEGSLINKAQEMASSISKTIQSALKIKSPSRVMMGFGENIGEGLIIGMDDMIKKVAQSSMRLSTAVQNAQGSVASSASKSRANQITNNKIINQSANIDLEGLVSAVLQLASRPVEATVSLDGRIVAESITPFVNTIQGNDLNSQLRRNGVKR